MSQILRGGPRFPEALAPPEREYEPLTAHDLLQGYRETSEWLEQAQLTHDTATAERASELLDDINRHTRLLTGHTAEEHVTHVYTRIVATVGRTSLQRS